ncbi:MAG: hypothetical protein AAFU53_13360 [Cyanobacteria bacterium J06632_3]
MAQQLKRWESPRRKGRNDKGRGGSAKQRQYKKRQKRLMKQLRQGIDGAGNKSPKKGEAHESRSFLISLESPRMTGETPCLYKCARGVKPPIYIGYVDS